MSSAWRRPWAWASARRATHSAAVANATRWPAWQARMDRPMARWVLPVPGGPRNTTLARSAMKSRVPRCSDDVAFERALVVVVEVLEGLAGREPGGADAAFAAVVLAGGDFAFEAGGEELLMGPAVGAGPFGEPVDRRRQRRCLQRPAQERQIARRFAGGVGAAITRPRGPGHRRRGRGPRLSSTSPVLTAAAPRAAGGDMGGVGDGAVLGQRTRGGGRPRRRRA